MSRLSNEQQRAQELEMKANWYRWRSSFIAPDTAWFEDKYAIRYVTYLDYRVTAFIFWKGSATFSDTICFWYKDFESMIDAGIAARGWCLRRGGGLERGPEVDDPPARLAAGVYRFPDAQVEKMGW